MTYGYCPDCGAPGVQRARDPKGPTTCERGHNNDHAAMLAEPLQRHGAMRFYFFQNILVRVSLIADDGSCFTPPQCDWSSTLLPLKLDDVSRIRMGMTQVEYLAIVGVTAQHMERQRKEAAARELEALKKDYAKALKGSPDVEQDDKHIHRAYD